jgi:hypothetical protein
MTDTIIVTPQPATQITVAATTASNTRVTSPIVNTGTATAPIIGLDQTLLSFTKSQVGLGNVDNTSDVNKPISTATQTALNLKAALASPTFTGTINGANLILSGDLTVNGTQTIINTSNLSVSDSLIYLSNNQFTQDALQIGFYGAYGYTGHTGNPGHVHTGLVRDSTDKIWKLFSNASEPDYAGAVGVDFSTATYDTLLAGGFKLNGGTSSQFLKADGTLDSNTYLTSVPVATTSVSGTVKVDGTTITINGSGVISGANTYSLPTASGSTLGGVKVGSNLSIDGSGVLSATVPVASSTTPLVNGTAAIGTSTTYARADHVHPSDTAKASLASDNTFTNNNNTLVAATGATQLVVKQGATQSTTDLVQVQNTSGTPLALVTSGGSILTGGNVGAGSTSVISTARLSVTGAASGIGVIVRANATTPGDLQQWQNSGGTVLGGINYTGQVYAGSTSPLFTVNGITLASASSSGSTSATFTYSATTQYLGSSAVGLTVKIANVTGNTLYNGTWTIASVATVTAGVTYSFTVTGSGFTATAGSGGSATLLGTASFTSLSGGTSALILQAAANQAVNILDVQNSAGSSIARISSAGSATFGAVTSNGGVTISGASNPLTLNGSAGSGGQLLTSTGATTTPAWTTATFPSTATGTGTILRANGTNWVASSSTFADTYTANSILYASGTNVVTGLAMGTANQVLSVNSSGTGLTWAAAGAGSLGYVGGFQTTSTAGASANLSNINQISAPTNASGHLSIFPQATSSLQGILYIGGSASGAGSISTATFNQSQDNLYPSVFIQGIGSSAGGTGYAGAVFIQGGVASGATNKGGAVYIDGGDNINSSPAGSVYIGTQTLGSGSYTPNINIGNVISTTTLVGTTSVTGPLKLTTGTDVTAAAGNIGYTGDLFTVVHSGASTGKNTIFAPAWAFSNATATAATTTTPQSIFQTGARALTLEAAKTYYFRLNLNMIFAYVGNNVGVQLVPTFSNAPVSINYTALYIPGTAGNAQSIIVSSTGAQTVTPTLSASVTNSSIIIEGYFQSNATTGGTIEFKYQLNGSSGGAGATIGAGSYQQVMKIGTGVPGKISSGWA